MSREIGREPTVAPLGRGARHMSLVCVVALMMLVAGGIGDATPRSETRAYTGGTAAAYSSCDASGDGVSRVCFTLDGTDERVTVSIDDATDLQVRGEWEFVLESGISLGRTFFCDHITLEVPEIAVGLRVYIHMLTNTASCTSVGAREVGGPGTMGTVTAEFS